MRVSYDRLWKLMKNNKMTKRDLAQAAGFSQYMMGQFTKAEYVSLKEIATLCGIFHCNIETIFYKGIMPSEVDFRFSSG